MPSWPRIDEALRQAAETKEIPGVVAVAASGRETIYEGAFGKRDLAKDDRMMLDSVFWIASMTKAITAAAATVPVTAYQQALLRNALEAAGVEFTNGDEPGVKLKAEGREG